MSVRAKFKLTIITPEDDGGGHIELEPVYSGSKENDEFFRMTPGGRIRMEVVNAEAVKAFEVGKEYYVDFTPA